MLLTTHSDLSDYIVELLSSAPYITASQIDASISKIHGRYSTASIYKAINLLLKAGVIVKYKTKFCLSAVWLNELEQFTNTSIEALFNLTTAKSLVEITDKLSWKFTNLVRLNEAYSHLIVMLAKLLKPQFAYSWVPHPWFHLLTPKQEEHYLKAMEKIKMFRIVGGSTPLDLEISKLWSKSKIETRFGDQNWIFKRNEYFVILSPYIISVQLKKQMENKMEDFFAQFSEIKGIDHNIFLNVFSGNTGTHTLQVENNAKKSELLAKKFNKSFKALL